MIDINKSQRDLPDFYAMWSSKSNENIEFDILSAERKAETIVKLFPRPLLDSLHRLLDFGCGYGAVINRLKQLQTNHIHYAIGFDFSEMALEVARKRSNYEAIRYQKLPELDARANATHLRQQVNEAVDAILLIDLLEHVTDCHTLIAELAPITKMFLIKLPIESSIFDDYLLPKEHPGFTHSNGHLREFNVNNVHYFIRKLGLNPVFETTYIYKIDDIFPPLSPGASKKRRIVRFLLKTVKLTLSIILPKKIFLRIVGGGGYLCLASYNNQYLLNP